jgi:hypothetical protein
MIIKTAKTTRPYQNATKMRYLNAQITVRRIITNYYQRKVRESEIDILFIVILRLKHIS